MESELDRKRERQLAKVERKRWYLLCLSGLQIFLGPPCTFWTLYVSGGDVHSERSVLSGALAALGLLWSLVGCLGVYAVSARRVQALVIFTSCEFFLAMITSCAAAMLLLLHHINCWAVRDTTAASTSDASRQAWMRCPNVSWLLGGSAAMVFYLSATASEALSLRLRIQKTGKRNLNWNEKPQRWKERNVRRGASAALRALAPHLKDGDSRSDEDTRIKYLATRDRRYINRSLLLRFDTIEAGEQRRLQLNLRKGYFKHGEIFAKKIYLSQVHEVILDEVDQMHLERPAEAAEGDGSSAAPYERDAPRDDKIRRRADGLAEGTTRPHGVLFAIARAAQRASRFVTRRFAEPHEPEDAGDTLYSVIVHARATSGWKWIVGLTSRSHTVVLDFRRPDERARFIAFVEALLPPSSNDIAPGPAADLSFTGESSAYAYAPDVAPPAPVRGLAPAPDGTPPNPRLPPLDLPPIHGGPDLESVGNAAPLLLADAHAATSSRKVHSEGISMFVGSWNMGDAVPPAALDAWISREDKHDLYAVATQECTDEHWMTALDSHLGASYVRVAERRMGGIALVVFTHRRHATKISGVETSFVPTGVLGVGTNKGAVALAFSIRGVRMCIVNAHLAAHQDKLLQRNMSVQAIAKHLRLGLTSLELPIQYHTIFCGDLNYRIDAERGEVIRLIEAEQWHALYEHDQLSQALSAERVLFGFVEAPIAFPPTYKYTRLANAPMRRRPFSKMGLRTPLPSFPMGKAPKGDVGENGAKERATDSSKPPATPLQRSGFAGQAMADRKPSVRFPTFVTGSFGNDKDVEFSGESNSPDAFATRTPVSGSPEVGHGTGMQRKYDEEKNRVPSWCDRVLWRALPGQLSLVSTGSSDCDDPHLYASDHAPMHTTFELDVPVLPSDLPLHHCTLYISNLSLYRARPTRSSKTGIADAGACGGSNLTARTAQGKGVPLPVAGNKLQNLPTQLTVNAHMLVLHKLMNEPPHHAAALNQDGRSATNIVIGPMLAQREFLASQQLQLRIVSASGGKLTELGQAVFSLSAAAQGKPQDFDVIVERLTVPAGFNLRGTAQIVWTKTLGEEFWQPSSRADHQRASIRRAQSSTSVLRSAGAPVRYRPGSGGAPARRPSTSARAVDDDGARTPGALGDVDA